jgi:hypothetical protein
MLAVLVLLCAAGCSTKLMLKAIPVREPDSSRWSWWSRPWAGDPDGLVVNRLGAYQVRVAPNPDKVAFGTAEGCCASLVDPVRVLQVDYQRMPFANGKLTLQLVKSAQTIQVGGVTGTTPATNVIKAVDEGLKTSETIE